MDQLYTYILKKQQKQQNKKKPRLINGKMHKKHTQQKDKIVQLKQLVSQPQCLKLLILHTPFLLNISTLHQCINLVKLDLSKNNLSSFPYLGDLPNLKFMFIHQNKLDIDSLVGIFQYRDYDQQGQKNSARQGRSVLSKSIVWVTYWGNKNQFNARHYLINNTSALAIDRNMVVLQQRSQSIILNPKFEQPFGPNTDVSQILQNRRKFNKNATEQEYMAQFWADMAEIRKKQIKLNPAIKIQKVFRGWLYRTKQIRKQQQRQNNICLVQRTFQAWNRIANYQRKLRMIMKKKNKQYLLYPIKQMKLEQAKRKIIDFVRQSKRKHLLRKMSLRAEYKFFNVLKSNQQALRSLYNVLHIDESNYVMVHIEGLQQFKRLVIPVASSMNQNQQILIQKNTNIYLRELYITPRKRRQFLRLLQLNQKSLVFEQRHNQNKKIINFNYTVYKIDTGMRKLYNADNIHFSSNQKNKMKGIDKSIQKKRVMELSQLVKVNGNGNKQLLRDIVRGVYFYNMGYLTNCVAPVQKINILSQYSIKTTTAILRIQRMWRGASLRKKIMKIARQNYLKTRAAAKIQRWYRNLPRNHRRFFMLDTTRTLRNFTNQYFYVKLDEYIKLVSNEYQEQPSQNKLTFLQQNIKIYISNQTKRLLLSWNSQSQNRSIQICNKINKPLFTKEYRNKILDNNSNNNNENMLLAIRQQHKQNYQQCTVSHLFHYRTQVSILNRKNTQYLEIKCANKYDCRLRVLALFLFTYQFGYRKCMTVLPKQCVNLYQIQYSFKKSIKNNQSVFVSQNSSQFQIQPMNSQNAKIYNLQFKFYVNQNNQKPIKFATQLKIILVESQPTEQQKGPQPASPKKKLRAMSYNQKFDISNFLIAETNQIKLDYTINEGASIETAPRLKKDSLKNIKVQRKTKVRGRDKLVSAHLESKEAHNFMLGDPRSLERLTTQPDMLTNERSLGSIPIQPEVSVKKQNINRNEMKYVQSRVLMRKRLAINNDQKKTNYKQMQQFTKNFINQGNFIQSQFLYGQIKRLKTQIQRKSNDQATRVKTEQSEGQKYLNRFKEDKLKRAHLGEQKHREQLYRSVIQKKADLQSKIQRKSEARQAANYKSLPRKMRINFAQECYPIIGKHPIRDNINN